MNCNPCKFCANYFVDYDRDIGWVEECAADAEDIKPCPDFKPRLVSEDLYEQLFNEDEAAFYIAEAE